MVRDIWSRSRLNNDVLEEAYNLVEAKGGDYANEPGSKHGRVAGSLRKQEFVVGLWLVDQRLKGRKLPIRVSDSVWHSVGALRDFKMKPSKKSGKSR